VNFTNPIMLAATGAVAVPILIHLLNRRRYTRVKWAAMRFIQVATDQNRRRIRIEDLVLLLVRCALLVALALAAARPLWRRFASALPTGGVTAVILVDDSSGMAGTDGVTTRFKSAKAAADAVVAALPTGSSAAVFLTSGHVDPIVPEPTRDLGFVRRAVQQSGVSDYPPEIGPAVRRALALLQKSTGANELYIITDGRRGGWGVIDPVAKMLADAHDDVASQVLLVGPAVTQNVGIAGLRAGGDLVPVGHPVRFDVTIKNYGTTDVRQLPVRLSVGEDKSPESEATIDSLAAGKSAVVSLAGTFTTPGRHWVTATIPHDAMPADDSRTITVRGIGTVRVLLIDGSQKNRDGQSASDFVRGALLPVPPDQVTNYFVKVEVAKPGDVTPSRLDQTDVVIAIDTPLPPEAAKAIDQFVRGGGGFFYFPGDGTDPAIVNAGLVDRLHLLPSRYGAGVGDAAKQDSALTFQASDFKHPIAAIWNERTNGSPAAAHVYRHLPMTAAAPSQVVLAYSDGTPAVLDQTVGLGTVMQFGTSADTSWTDLPLHPSFLPLLYRSLAAAVQQSDAGSNVKVGDPFVRRVPIEQAGRPVTVVDPQQKSTQSTVVLRDDAAVVAVSSTDRAGGYRVRVGTDPETRFAAQLDPDGSELQMLTDDQTAALSAVATVRKWDEHGGDRQSTSGRLAGEWWFPLAVLALLFTAVEPLLANWMSRSK
jgi:hypothetical protein